MSAHPLRVAVIVASTREGRFGPTIAAWFAGEAAHRADMTAEIVDLANADPIATDGSITTKSSIAPGSIAGEREIAPGSITGEREIAPGSITGKREITDGSITDGRSITEQLGAADAFVVVTPEYNHSYPAPLKAVLDSHSREWLAKPVGFVSYGGLSGGLRAVEHLRPIFSELHAVTVRDTVSFHGGRSCFGPDGLPLDLKEPAAAAHRLLDRIAWWGLTLRDAHQARPYATA
jgi:NAD(P)H-dependent FMN reductase